MPYADREGERRAGFGKVLDAALSRSVEAAPLEVRVSAEWSALEEAEAAGVDSVRSISKK